MIAETSIRYHRPLVYADEILVTPRTVRLGRTSFEMEYAVWRDGLCALGRAVLILVVNATGEKTPLPPDLRERILARDPDVPFGLVVFSSLGLGPNYPEGRIVTDPLIITRARPFRPAEPLPETGGWAARSSYVVPASTAVPDEIVH